MVAPGGQTLSGHVSGGTLNTIRYEFVLTQSVGNALKCFSEEEIGMLLSFKTSLRDQALVPVM